MQQWSQREPSATGVTARARPLMNSSTLSPAIYHLQPGGSRPVFLSRRAVRADCQDIGMHRPRRAKLTLRAVTAGRPGDDADYGIH